MKKIFINYRISIIVLLACGSLKGLCQAPNISYASPQTYTVGIAIPPLSATTNTGGGTPVVNGQTSIFAGNGGWGAINGTGTGAYFAEPVGVAVDSKGNVFVADYGNNMIRKITPAGVVTTLAGSGAAGSADGTGTAATFYWPLGLAIDRAGNLYVAEKHNNMIRKVTPAGVVTTLAGSTTAGFVNGTGTAASFSQPAGVAVDAVGNVYVGDYGNMVIRKITPAGVVTTFAGSGVEGSANGAANVASFNFPCGLAFDLSGNLIVADRNSNMIRKITPAGVVSTIAGNTTAGFADGTGTAAQFNNPFSVTVDAFGNIYVADGNNNRIRAISPLGVVTTLSGNGIAGVANGTGSAAEFNTPRGVAVDAIGNLYVGGYTDMIVRKVAYAPFTLNQPLPKGLNFNPTTGTISGTPTAASAATNYTISAYNLSGSSSASLQITTSNLPLNPSQSQNYIATYVPRVPAITSSAAVYAASPDPTQIESSIQYIDGLGRPLQTVQAKGSPGGHDVIQPYAYDQFGREAAKYLPYTVAGAALSDGSYKSNALTAGAGQAQFYTSPPAGVSSITTPQALTAFEPSPLNRIVEQGAPGDPWQLTGTTVSTGTSGHTVKMIYASNDSINYWAHQYGITIDVNGNRTLVFQGTYKVNQLYVTVTQDENWTGQINAHLNTTEEYKDKEGHVVLKRTYNFNAAASLLETLSTYYVYDDFGNLSYVLPPSSGADATGGISSTNNQTTLNDLCYQYGYDGRNRVITKRLPGKGVEEIVYNLLDQAILVRDANQKSRGEWGFTKFDALGRVIITGFAKDTSSRAPLQGYVTNMLTLVDTVKQWETPTPGSGIQGYTDTAFPWGNNQVPLVVNYYDDYSFQGQPSTVASATGASTMTKGLLTATKTAVLNTMYNAHPDMLWAVHYYDNLGRVTQTYNQHYLGGVLSPYNYDVVTNTYDFTNEVIATTRQHYATNAANTASTQNATIANTYVYDHMGRKKQTFEQINGGPNVLLSQTDYNETGQVMTKHLHSYNNGNSFLQDVAYTYNERGWLLSNSAPLFAMQLYYNTGTNKQYNGNIAYQYWGTPGNLSNNYTYTYDYLNRLTSGTSVDNNNETGITYDLEGNITTLNRYRNNTLIDQLTYHYANSNQVYWITDQSANFQGLPDGSWDYLYDPNGNLQYVESSVYPAMNKSNTYNMLNLPLVATIQSGTVTFTYDAAGNKLRKVDALGSTTTATDYINGIQYGTTGGATTLSFIQTEEGKAVPIPSGGYDYYYYLGDNLGNTRITFDTQPGLATVLQQDDYYPFGYEISRGTVPSPKNEYLYNKKELQEELTEYDYGFRQYDPVIARWTTIDPLADMSQNMSPYVFCVNNPILFTDKLGLDTGKMLKEVIIRGTKDVINHALFNSLWFMQGKGRNWVVQQASIKTTKDANNLDELLNNSLSHTNKSILTGEVLDKLKKDPAFIKWKNQIIKLLKTDPRFKKLTFTQSKIIAFGGDAWSSLSNFDSAASNELTWAVRHADVDASGVVKTDGTIVLNFQMNDTLDLSSQSGRGWGYNTISDATGFLWHDIGGGNEYMQVDASWSETINK